MRNSSLYTSEQLARRWRITPEELEQLRQEGKAPKAVLLPNGEALWRGSDVRQWEQENLQG